MKYNEKYGRWFTNGGLVYRYDSKQDKLVLCKQSDSHGYKSFSDFKRKRILTHRAIYETFVGEIPEGYQIDHINTKKDDNRLENLHAVTPKGNMTNPLTRKRISEVQIGKKLSDECKKKISESKKGKFKTPTSEFGKKYFEHFGCSKTENPKQYRREQQWFLRNKRCRWE